MGTMGKAILTAPVYLTAIMTLIAGMPHFVCRCTTNLPKVESRPAAQTAVCCCCGSCGSMLGGDQPKDKPSCCSQKSPKKSKGTTSSPQAAGSDCTKVTGLPKEPAVATIKS